MTINPDDYAGRKPGRPRTRERDENDVAIERDDDTDSLPEDLDELIDSYAEGEGYVFLRRQELGEWVFLAKVDFADAKLDQIQARFGGGKYRVQIVDDTGRQKRQRTFRIAGRSKNVDSDDGGESKSELEQRLERLEAANNPPTQPGQVLGMADVLKVALDALTKKPAVDPLMQTLITALVSGRPNSSGIDPVKLQELLQNERTSAFEQGKQLGEALAAGMGEGDGVARVLATTLPGVIDAFKSAKQSYDRNAPRQATATAHVTEPAAPVSSPAPVEETAAMNGTSWINALRPAVPIILKWAREGKDAQIKAANTVDDLNDVTREAIAVQSEEPNFVQSVISAIPEFQAPDVQPWIFVFLTTVQEILTAPDDEGGEA